MKVSKSKISVLMAEKNMNQQDLADTAGMSRGNLSTILNGKSCQPTTVHRIAEALGARVSSILIDEE